MTPLEFRPLFEHKLAFRQTISPKQRSLACYPASKWLFGSNVDSSVQQAVSLMNFALILRGGIRAPFIFRRWHSSPSYLCFPHLITARWHQSALCTRHLTFLMSRIILTNSRFPCMGIYSLKQIGPLAVSSSLNRDGRDDNGDQREPSLYEYDSTLQKRCYSDFSIQTRRVPP